MIIKNNISEKGFSIDLFKGANISYPQGTWERLDNETKKTIVDNVIYLKISPYAMFLDKDIHFHSSLPLLKKLGDSGVIGDIPRIAEEDKVSAKELIERFNNKKITFENDETKLIDGISAGESALLGISFGKDSLLSYAVAKELKLNPKLVMVHDFWDIEAKHKFGLIEKFETEFQEKINIVTDEMDNISNYKRINITGSESIVGANAMNAYAAMLLPLAIPFRAKYILFGNEQNFNDYFINAEGFKVYPSYEQSSEWMKEQNKFFNELTNNQVKITSLIEPIYNIAEVRVLFNRYPEIAKYQMSCGLSKSKRRKERWCYLCPMCAKSFLYLKANGIDPKNISFNRDFFGKEQEKLYPLFNEAPDRIYEKPKAVRDEQLFAFYLAYKNHCTGYLIDEFKNRFLDEAKQREDELYNKFFKIHEAFSIPTNLKQEISSIYREELK